MTELERRSATVETEGSTIYGTAIVFGSLSEDLGGFREVIESSAVDRTFDDQIDVRALVDHEPGKIIGRLKAGTLALEKRGAGLAVRITPPNTTVGRDILESVKRGDVNGMSFSFAVVRPGGERFEDRDTGLVRYISDMRIREVSLVTFPAYEATDAGVAQGTVRELALARGRKIAWLRTSSVARGV
jgi:HK97 family phage prohead protease